MRQALSAFINYILNTKRRKGITMIREIVKDQILLSQKAVEAGKEDIGIALDLMDTLKAHEDERVGMAANMIGVAKRIIIIDDKGTHTVMFNPVILKKYGKLYDTEESCLSHIGVKPVKRYEKIRVEYMDINFKKKVRIYSGFEAQIIQHEVDHCEGILI